MYRWMYWFFCFWNDHFYTGNLKDPNCCPVFTKKIGAIILAEHPHNPIILLAPQKLVFRVSIVIIVSILSFNWWSSNLLLNRTKAKYLWYVCFTSELKLRNEIQIITHSNHLPDYTLHFWSFFTSRYMQQDWRIYGFQRCYRRISPADFTGVAVRWFTTHALCA